LRRLSPTFSTGGKKQVESMGELLRACLQS
jgi:hypothetical protein